MEFPSTGDEQLDEALGNWFKWAPPESEDTKAIKDLLTKGEIEQLKKLMLKRCAFGTAGIRGSMGPGFSQLNDLVIIQTSQGLVHYIIDSSPHDEALNLLRKRGVVIGYDGRHNSQRWGQFAAAAFRRRGFKVYLYRRIVPTPWVPFAVQYFNAVAGIVITASHNPKNDNGYKVYWSEGPQILPDIAEGIQKSIMGHLEPEKEAFKGLKASVFSEPILPELICPYDEINRHYCKVLTDSLLDINMTRKSNIKIVYTAMHGVGANFIDMVFNAVGFPPVIHVVEQRRPDPNFPTVKFPNPEEGKSALDLAIKTAKKNEIQYIIANDPDADRLAIAQEKPDGTWKVFTGNELGSLLGWFLFHVHMIKNPECSKKDLMFIASTVSSKMLKTIADIEGLCFEETLTGFKWMANKALELEKTGKKVLLAFEESIGFMCGTQVLDKDGITAAVRGAELIAYLKEKEKGKTLIDKLNDLYNTYGYHYNENSYYFCYDPDLTKQIFERLRNFNGPNTYPDKILDGKYTIAHVRDLTTGYDSTKPDMKAVLPVDSSSQMITFYFTNGFVATLRTSGTEPKIKYYAEFIAKPDEKDWASIEKESREMIKAVIDTFLEPEKNNLQPKQD